MSDASSGRPAPTTTRAPLALFAPLAPFAKTNATVTGSIATVAGVAAHAVVTNIRKRSVIAEVHAEDQKES